MTVEQARARAAGILSAHRPDPVFGCDCQRRMADLDTGVAPSLDVSWESHVAFLLHP